MSNNKNMSNRKNAAFIILTLPALAFAAAVQAEEGMHGSVTAGVASAQLDYPSAKFGKFTGVTDDTVYLLGGADIQARNGTRYWDFKANDLGLDNRRLTLDGGNTGSYKFNFRYEQQPNELSNNSKTPFNGVGSSTLTLPAGFVTNASTANMTALAASLKGVELGTKRKEGEAGVSYELGKSIDLSFSLKRQLKDGTQSFGAARGFSTVTLPAPVDYQTDEYRAGLAWHNERGQARVDYFLSQFSNANQSLTWDSPYYTGVATTSPTRGRASLAPDNQAQRLNLSGSYNLAPATRLSAVAEMGKMTQNVAFLPYTINAVALPVALPRSSAEAQIDTRLLKLELASQPLPKVSLNARYRYYETENKTPRDLYQMVASDNIAAASPFGQVLTTAAGALYNRPYDSTQNQLNLDGSYNFGYGTTVKAGYEHEKKDYSHRAVKATREGTFTGKLNKRWDAGATLSVDLAEGRKRSNGGYNETWVFEDMHTTGYISPLAANVRFDNLSGMRQYDIADRDRSKQGVGLTLLPHQNLTVGVNVNRLKDAFDASQFGLQEQKNNNYTVNVTLTPEPVSSVSLFFTNQFIVSRQNSRSYAAATKAANSIDPNRDWSARNQDSVDTIGVTANRSFMEDKLLVKAGYGFSRTDTDISFAAGSAVTPAPKDMPGVKSRRTTLDLSATYSMKKELDVQVGAMWERYRSDDWATDGIAPGTSLTGTTGLLTLSASPADYRAVVLRTAMNYKF